MRYDIVLFTDRSDAMGTSRPMGAYKIASALREEGYSVFVLHLFSEFVRNGKIYDILESCLDENSLYVGFSGTLFIKKVDSYSTGGRGSYRNVDMSTWPITEEEMQPVLEYIKLMGVKTVYGGAWDFRKYPDLNGVVDYYVVGLGERPALDLAKHIREGTHLPYNIAYGTKTKVLDYDIKGNGFDFRHSMTNYIKEDFFDSNEALGIEFARGCIFKCKFCDYPLLGKKKKDLSYIRGIESIKHELKRNYEMFGTTNYIILDDTFNETTEKLEALVQIKEELGIDLLFNAFIRIDLVSRDLKQIELLKRLGVRLWFLGIETLNPASSKAISKGIKEEETYETIRKANEIFEGKLNTFGSLIIGLPEDNYDSVKAWGTRAIEESERGTFSNVGFQVLEMAGESELVRNKEQYGYTVESDGKWKNEIWDWYQAKDLMQEMLERNPDFTMHSFYAMMALSLGYDIDYIISKKMKDLYQDKETHRRAHSLKQRYIDKVCNHFNI